MQGRGGGGEEGGGGGGGGVQCMESNSNSRIQRDLCTGTDKADAVSARLVL